MRLWVHSLPPPQCHVRVWELDIRVPRIPLVNVETAYKKESLYLLLGVKVWEMAIPRRQRSVEIRVLFVSEVVWDWMNSLENEVGLKEGGCGGLLRRGQALQWTWHQREAQLDSVSVLRKCVPDKWDDPFQSSLPTQFMKVHYVSHERGRLSLDWHIQNINGQMVFPK